MRLWAPDVKCDPDLREERGKPDPPPVIRDEEGFGPVPKVTRGDIWAGEEGVAEALAPVTRVDLCSTGLCPTNWIDGALVSSLAWKV